MAVPRHRNHPHEQAAGALWPRVEGPGLKQSNRSWRILPIPSGGTLFCRALITSHTQENNPDGGESELACLARHLARIRPSGLDARALQASCDLLCMPSLHKPLLTTTHRTRKQRLKFHRILTFIGSNASPTLVGYDRAFPLALGFGQLRGYGFRGISLVS